MPRDLRVLLEDMLEAIARIETYTVFRAESLHVQEPSMQ